MDPGGGGVKGFIYAAVSMRYYASNEILVFWFSGNPFKGISR